MENSEFGPVHVEAGCAGSLRCPISIHPRTFMVLVMILSDLLAVLGAVIVAAAVRNLVMGGTLAPESFTWAPGFIAVFFISAALRGLYPAIGMSAIEQFRQLTMTISILFLIIIGLTYFFKVADSYSRLLMGLSWFICLFSVPFNRTIIRHLMVKADLWGEPVVIIGRADGVSRIAAYFKNYPKIGLRPQVLVTTAGDISTLDLQSHKNLLQRMRRLQSAAGINTAVVVYENLSEFIPIREAFRDAFERVVLISSTDPGIELGGVNVRQYGDILTFEIRQSLLNRSAQLKKRAIDITVSGLGLLLLSPVLGLIALAIALDSPGGVFYRQRRIGKGGREFGMLKFRTMRRDADEVLHRVLASDPVLQREWQTYQKLQRDPRITRVGRLLRRFSLDELPQLWNVLIGEMSIVGPRPIMLNQQEMYGPNFRHYIRVVPGITGLWQISGRNRTSFAQRTAFDAEYINNWTIWSDIYILVRTAWVVLRRDGAC